jgi:hypothetical protein
MDDDADGEFEVTATINVDTETRSRHQLILGNSCVYIDFERRPLRVVRASFDGYGCCRLVAEGVSAEMWEAMFGGLADRDRRPITGELRSDLLRHLRRVFAPVVPGRWADAFQKWTLV